MKYLLSALLIVATFKSYAEENSADIIKTISENQLVEISQSKKWHRLLHYYTDWLGRYKSDIDEGQFFLSPDGKQNPLAELKATIQAVNSNQEIGPLKQSPRCTFQARYSFIAESLNLKIPDKKCDKYEGFIQRFNQPQKAYLVFSAAYSGNPASMFGHLFLRIGSSKRNGLLDKGINFAAQVPADENPLAFFYFGVFGGYYGSWSMQTYYEKINEYVKSENRDLWEYEINFTEKDVRFLIDHIWELETSGLTDYYFFDENCAYQMMRLLEVARPEWDLTKHTIYVIPGEILKNLYSNDQIVREVYYRPSLRKKLMHQYQMSSVEEQKIVLEVINNKKDITTISQVSIADTLSTYFDFRRQLKKGKLSDEEKEKWNQVKIRRSQFGSNKDDGDAAKLISPETRPDLGHDAFSISPIFGAEETLESRTSYFGFKIKSAYHDLLNRELGYKRFSEIQFPWIELRYRTENKHFFVEELGGIKVVSLTPYHSLDQNFSWKMGIAYTSAKDFGCLECRYLTWDAGIGFSYLGWSEDLIFYNLFSLRMEAGENFLRGYRALPHIETGFIQILSDKFKIMGSGFILTMLKKRAVMMSFIN